jgi:hypothetical protein
MRIYELDTQEDQAYLSASKEVRRQCDPDPPRSLAATWSAPTCKIVGCDRYHSYLPKTDFPTFLPTTVVLSGRAVDRLRHILIPCGEILPIHLSNDRDTLYLFNVTRIVNAIDMTSSKFIRFPGGGIMECERLIFDAARIPDDTWFFKTTQLGAVTEIFATDAAVTAVKQARLTGYKFRLAWSNE